MLADLVAHVEGFQNVTEMAGKAGLVLELRDQLVQVVAGLVLDPFPPHVDQLGRTHRRRRAGQAFAHHHGERILQRGIFPARDFRRIGFAVPVVEHRGNVARNALHAHGADRVAAGLLDSLEQGACLRPAGRVFGMNGGVVAGELQGHGIAQAPGDRDFLSGELARGLRQAGAIG